MGGVTASLDELPLDILLNIFPYLDPRSFLRLCSTCRSLNDPSIRLDASYWRHATRSTFRVPNQHVIEGDGRRWQKLFRRMLTQNRIFTWGKNDRGCLGHGDEGSGFRCHFPKEMENVGHIGTIADIQCGGWSTSMLTAEGRLYTSGAISQSGYGAWDINLQTSPLRFPDGHRHQGTANEASSCIRQFSAGRSHVLALSDNGRIWSWNCERYPAVLVKFLHVDVEDVSRTPSTGRVSRVRKVVAGWDRSSAYITGTGIVIWRPASRNAFSANESPPDAIIASDAFAVPRTGYTRPRGSSRDPDEQAHELGLDVGEVTNHIILERFVIFVTDIGKIFAAQFDDGDFIPDIVELDNMPSDSPNSKTSIASDVQGSFRSFAVLRKNGEVVTGKQDDLQRIWDLRFGPQQTTDGHRSTLNMIPALQHTGVISLAFGDYHFHALHGNGQITSYGTEPQTCGALGLSSEAIPEYLVRGIFRHLGDARMVRHAYTTGRRVWFEPEKRQWMRFMSSGGRDPAEAAQRIRMMVMDEAARGETSEWFEQQGRDWDRHPDLADADEDGLGAYFALSVAAAGWHSGAIVLVNEDLACRLSESCIIKDNSTGLMETTASTTESSQESPTSGILNSVTSTVSSWARWYLGLPPPAASQAPRTAAISPNHPSHFTNPMQHGASPGPGYRYRWAEDDFPRLRLADGREMPGSIPFASWRDERPEFVLDIDA